MRKEDTFVIFLSSLVIISSFITPHYASAREYTSPNYNLTAPRVVVTGGTSYSGTYSLEGAQVGDAVAGKAESGNYRLEATVGPKLPPQPPTVNAVISPTASATQILSGEKDINTSIYINGYFAVASDSSQTWSCEVALSEGDNILNITSRNIYQLESEAVCVYIFVDSSAPVAPTVTDDGSYTRITTELHAEWSCDDPQSGIVEYQYAIGTSAYTDDVVGWTSAGTQTGVTHSGLSLVNGMTYYVTVKAKNSAGVWSQPGCSDGISVNTGIPTIVEVLPKDLKNGYVDDNIELTVTADDNDGDPLVYRFSLDGNVLQSWSANASCTVSTASASWGIHTITVEVSDDKDGRDSKNLTVFLFRRPLAPPSL